MEGAQSRTRTRRFPLEGGPGAVGRCRDLTRQVLADWFTLSGAAGRVMAQDVLLLVSEVVTNACRHGGAPYELRLDRAPGRLLVQVSDTGPGQPTPHGPHRAARASGHGLYLLERLSSRWGWVRREAGKTVWFEMTVPE
ncbi:ATP-binding protein [Streptomyces sp. NPDC051219]|uniref:ATP-binding protein n=1 Tax=Streptomyces sp. NPDC051219 TaxID=3155283 RepID=UPI003414CCC3